MPDYEHPAVYVTEVEGRVHTIEGVPTSVANFIGPDGLAHLKARLERLPPAWTDANRGDPGLVLIEMMAWIAETTLFRAGKLPDRAARPLSRVAAASLQALQGCRLPKGSALKKVQVFATRVDR